MNPFTIFDTLLVEWASPKWRRTIHGLLSLALALAAIWTAANGDWRVALGALAAALYTEANRVNTHPEDVDEDLSAWESDEEFDDDEFAALHDHDGQP